MILMGIDVGTTGIKIILINQNGDVVAKHTEEYLTSSPHPMWSEQNPEEWWTAACEATGAVMSAAKIAPDEIQGVGLSGQMVGLVALDADCRVVRPCIMWNDQRSADVTVALTEKIGLDLILKETGNPLFATFVAPKIVWMRGNEPESYARIRHILLPKDYIAYRLTGNLNTEVSDASGTCLFNVRERRWSQTMIDAMDIPREWLPDCLESDQVAGSVTVEAAGECGLGAGTPVIAGAGDQPAQALGSGIVLPGLCSVTIGTSGVVFAQSDSHLDHPEGRLHSFCHSVSGAWYLMGVMLSAGGSFSWLRDILKSRAPATYEQMTAMAATAPAGSEGLVFLPYLTGERCPHDDPHARGGWIGLTARHDTSHLVRSVMEGISFGLLDSVTLMRDLDLKIDKMHVSGGASESQFWRQMLADIFETEIAVTNAAEGAAFGAAMLAGIGTGQFADAAQAAEALIRVTDTNEPDEAESRIYGEIYDVYRSLYPLLKNSSRSLTDFIARHTGDAAPADRPAKTG